MKQFRYILEAILVWLCFFIFRLMPYHMASNIGGWIGRTIGPRLAASRKAIRNLEQTFPGISPEEYHRIVTGMWDNLGRVFAEYPHLRKIIDDVEVVGLEHLESLPKDKSYVSIGGHLANWELAPFLLNYRTDRPVTAIYRAPNNPYVDYLLEQCRTRYGSGHYVPKSASGTRSLVQSMKDEQPTLILFDQKYNQGIPSDFFGRPAMTSTAFVQLARKFDSPILPIWVERLKGASFRIRIEPAFRVGDLSDEQVLARAHQLLEAQIRRHPEQWLWIHRRWDSKALQ